MKKLLLTTSILLIVFACTPPANQDNTQPEEVSRPDISFEISSPPAELELDPFYKKYLKVNGIHITSSYKVPDEALEAAGTTIHAMTNFLSPEVLNEMVKRDTRVAVMARYEGTTDIPEHAHLESDTTLNWDVRARGLGGSLRLPLTSCAEENLLCYQIDKYHAEDILIHEFAHSIHGIGIISVDSTFDDLLKQTLQNALDAGKYENTYAATNFHEYWAEGDQNWFGVNAEVPEPDGKHNYVNTREELEVYDPELFAILAQYFSVPAYNPSCHAKANLYTR